MVSFPWETVNEGVNSFQIEIDIPSPHNPPPDGVTHPSRQNELSHPSIYFYALREFWCPPQDI